MQLISSYQTNEGVVIMVNNTNHTYLDAIVSYEKFQGTGTKLFREVFRRCLESGHEGRVELQAASTSHIFHLKMGFVPREREISDKGSYIEQNFVPALINIMERCPKGALPCTENFGAVDMYLSQEGIERWKGDIEGKKTFEPFRHFEPLQNLMTPEQKQKIKTLFGQ